MNEKTKLDNFANSLAEFVSKDIESAKNYLAEEGIDSEFLKKNGLRDLYNTLSKHKLEKGKAKMHLIHKNFEEFEKITKDKSLNEVIEMYPSIPKVAYRKFEEDKLDQNEIEDLLRDASFLSFLEKEFDANK